MEKRGKAELKTQKDCEGGVGEGVNGERSITLVESIREEPPPFAFVCQQLRAVF